MQADKKRVLLFISISIMMTSIFISGCFPEETANSVSLSDKPMRSVQQDSLNFLVTALILAIIFAVITSYLLYQNHQKNMQLEIKNKESLRQKEELIALSAANQATAEAKFSFFTHISNAFRVPLTLILLPLDEMLESRNSANAPKHQLNLIHRNVQRLLLMVNQLTDFRKIAYDKMKIDLTRQDFVVFSKDIISSFKALALKKKHRIKTIRF
ncbi:sensor histidine kinase [Pedobacter lusitanus]|uniref:sensor histidine kinase n=1 Tax=Pedobacter lusitanus TaxID=1503925 RepID=UPI001269C00C|nr:HAMP domain-containing histidine kinase [Pedobacter lusitanus]